MRALWIIVVLLAAMAAGGCSRQEAGWRDAARADSAEAYEEYLARYPGGAHAGEARARILALREARDWARALRLRTPEAWQRYLAEWPDGSHAARARAELAEYVPAPVAGGVWSVQLGAFAAEAAAQSARARLGQALMESLAGLPLLILAPQDDPSGVWRLRTGTLPEAEARALCARLREQGVDCAPVVD